MEEHVCTVFQDNYYHHCFVLFRMFFFGVGGFAEQSSRKKEPMNNWVLRWSWVTGWYQLVRCYQLDINNTLLEFYCQINNCCNNLLQKQYTTHSIWVRQIALFWNPVWLLSRWWPEIQVLICVAGLFLACQNGGNLLEKVRYLQKLKGVFKSPEVQVTMNTKFSSINL